MLAIVLAALTVCATTIGGLVAVKSKDRFHLILGLAAGLLLGLVAFDLLPVVFSDATIMVNGKIALVSVAFLAGFLALHFLEESFAGHEPVESDYEHDHSHYGNIAGGLGAVAMAIHVFLDGLALGVEVGESAGDFGRAIAFGGAPTLLAPAASARASPSVSTVSPASAAMVNRRLAASSAACFTCKSCCKRRISASAAALGVRKLPRVHTACATNARELHERADFLDLFRRWRLRFERPAS